MSCKQAIELRPVPLKGKVHIVSYRQVEDTEITP